MREECGIFGISNYQDASALVALGLHALQHRGPEAAGIVTFDKNHFHAERRLGLVSEHFTKQSVIDRLSGNTAIGHVRYSTTGGTVLRRDADDEFFNITNSRAIHFIGITFKGGA